MVEIKLEVNGKKFNSEGPTVLEALQNLSITLADVKTKGTVKVKQGKKEVEKFLYLKQLRPLAISKFRRIVLAKQLNDLLSMTT